jgi:hypothetical protein
MEKPRIYTRLAAGVSLAKRIGILSASGGSLFTRKTEILVK